MDDLKTLKGSEEVNDEVINRFFQLIDLRSENDPSLPKSKSFNHSFMTLLMKHGHTRVARWTKNVNIFKFKVLFFPIFDVNHWTLAVIDFESMTIRSYDSAGRDIIGKGYLQALKDFVHVEWALKSEKDLEASSISNIFGLELESVKDIPQQVYLDCGIFCVRYAEYLSRGSKITFTTSDIPKFRKRLVYELTNFFIISAENHFCDGYDFERSLKSGMYRG